MFYTGNSKTKNSTANDDVIFWDDEKILIVLNNTKYNIPSIYTTGTFLENSYTLKQKQKPTLYL